MRLLEDTGIALGIDMYEGARALYKTMQVTAEGSGVADILEELGRRFYRPSRSGGVPKPETPAAGSGTGEVVN